MDSSERRGQELKDSEARETAALDALLAQAAEEARDDEATARALKQALVRAAVQPRASVARLGQVTAVAAALLCGFLLRGLLATDPPPQTAAPSPARVVRVEVPVVRERVVRRVVRVPVVRVRYVRVAPAAPSAASRVPAEPLDEEPAFGPVAVTSLTPEALSALPLAKGVTYSESVRPARLALVPVGPREQ